MAVFYDTHAHLAYPDLSAELPELLRRAHAAGIDRIITIGTDAESSQRCVELAEQHEELYAVVGWHPSDAMEAPADVRPFLRECGAHPKVVALGETGLDYYRLPGKADGGNTRPTCRSKRNKPSYFASISRWLPS